MPRLSPISPPAGRNGDAVPVPMDPARREAILKAYDVHARRFSAIAANPHHATGLFQHGAGAAAPAIAPSATRAHTPGRQDDTSILTERQREVLVLVGAGLSNDEISAKLTITVETVKSHVQHILRGLGARNRAHAVSLGHRNGALG